jgi:hypothetical protein
MAEALIAAAPQDVFEALERSRKVAAVREALASSPYRPLHQVEVDFDQGQVALRGIINSYYLKQLAQTLALKTIGNGHVFNGLDVTATP